jgi:phosphoribosylglycinamide formyltransferase-1
MLKIGVLISGRGSNLKALIDAAQAAEFPAEIVCVISNKADAGGLDYARMAHIPTIVVRHQDFKDKVAFEAAIDTELNTYKVQLICLAGFMRLLTSWFVERWRDRLINIHPSLLPSFPGLDTHRKALDYGVRVTGCTVHFVRTEMDHGPIILQAAVPVSSDDTEESLAARVLSAEHKVYAHAVRLIAENKVNVYKEQAFVVDAKMPDFLVNPAF